MGRLPSLSGTWPPDPYSDPVGRAAPEWPWSPSLGSPALTVCLIVSFLTHVSLRRLGPSPSPFTDEESEEGGFGDFPRSQPGLDGSVLWLQRPPLPHGPATSQGTAVCPRRAHSQPAGTALPVCVKLAWGVMVLFSISFQINYLTFPSALWLRSIPREDAPRVSRGFPGLLGYIFGAPSGPGTVVWGQPQRCPWVRAHGRWHAVLSPAPAIVLCRLLGRLTAGSGHCPGVWVPARQAIWLRTLPKSPLPWGPEQQVVLGLRGNDVAVQSAACSVTSSC